jgi:predicted dehydrogenase
MSLEIDISVRSHDPRRSTFEWGDILSSEAVVISSPTDTHIGYLLVLAEMGDRGYAYIEKPGFSKSKSCCLVSELCTELKDGVIVGYHMRYCNPVLTGDCQQR